MNWEWETKQRLATIKCRSSSEESDWPDFVPEVFEEFEKLFRKSPGVNLWTLHSYLTTHGRDCMKDVAGVSINYELNHGDSAIEIEGLDEAFRSYEVTYHQGRPEPKIIAVHVFWTEVVGLREKAEKLRAKLSQAERNARKVDRLEAELARATSVPVINAETGAETREPAPKRARDAPGGGLKALKDVSDATAGKLLKVKRECADALSRVECVVCMERPRAVQFLPCNHLVVCASCATDECPFCNGAVESQITVANES